MSRTKTILLWVMAAFYVLGGFNHLVNPSFYLAIMPPYIPAHGAMVALSGVAEIALGVLVLVPRSQVLAAWGIIAMLVVFLPVHIHMLVNQELFPEVGVAFLWLRFPLQGVLGLWAWWYTRPFSASA